MCTPDLSAGWQAFIVITVVGVVVLCVAFYLDWRGDRGPQLSTRWRTQDEIQREELLDE